MEINDMEFIRFLIDLIDSKKEQAPAAPTVVINIGKDGDVSSSHNPTETESPIDGTDVFIPPLQAKIEMMKKMTGVEVKNQDMLSSEDDEPLDG